MVLQRWIGNQAVSRILQRRAAAADTAADVAKEPASAAVPLLAGEVLETVAGGNGHSWPGTKLVITEPGDVHEQEADRVADQVMSASLYSPVGVTPLRVQRFANATVGHSNRVPASVDRTLASPGKQMEPALRDDMEQRFGFDFSQVRVHSGADAEQSARNVIADAYTVGHNIVFGKNRYAPGTRGGRWLLAHELTHVIQQTGRGASTIQRKNNRERHEWTIVTRITVESNTTGEGRGQAVTSGGQTIPINIEMNKLGVGTHILGAPDLRPEWDTWSRVHMGSVTANLFVYDLPPGVALADELTIVVGQKRRSVKEIWKDIQTLPKQIQAFVIDPKSPRAAKAQDYETALRIGQKLASAGVTPDEMFDYVQSLGGDKRYSDASIDAFLAERTRKEERRTQNIVERQKTETRLFGREDLYRRYLSLLKDERRLGLSPHGEVESELYDAYLGEKKYIYAKQPNAVDTLSQARDQLRPRRGGVPRRHR